MNCLLVSTKTLPITLKRNFENSKNSYLKKTRRNYLIVVFFAASIIYSNLRWKKINWATAQGSKHFIYDNIGYNASFLNIWPFIQHLIVKSHAARQSIQSHQAVYSTYRNREQDVRAREEFSLAIHYWSRLEERLPNNRSHCNYTRNRTCEFTYTITARQLLNINWI